MVGYKEPQFDWNEEFGLATCILTDKNNVYIGTAQCGDNDKDMQSRRTGEELALMRAELSYFIGIRDNELKPKIQCLNHYHSTLITSRKYNQDSYEIKRLLKEIDNLQNDLKSIKNLIKIKREEINNFIDSKDKLYKKVRAKRG